MTPPDLPPLIVPMDCDGGGSYDTDEEDAIIAHSRGIADGYAGRSHARLGREYHAGYLQGCIAICDEALNAKR